MGEDTSGWTRKAPSAFGTQQQVAISANDVINRMFPKRRRRRECGPSHESNASGSAGEGTARSQPRKVGGGGGGGKDEKEGRVFHVAITLPQYALHVDPSIVSPPPLLANLPKVDLLLIF